jgi:heme/copper-type cytochrome/quinol oxidase subunit 3
MTPEIGMSGGLSHCHESRSRPHAPEPSDTAPGADRVVAGGINTLVLLTSGLFAALAVQAISNGQVRRCRQWLACAFALVLVAFGYLLAQAA